MDFRVGAPSKVGPPPPRRKDPRDQIEARLLAIRPPRSRGDDAPRPVRERRAAPQQRDPRGGRVLVLMIPDGQQLPAGIEKGLYRVFLRFARR